MKKKNVFNLVKSYVFIAAGLFLSAFAWTAFLIPSEIIGGGVAGIAGLVYFATGLPAGVSIFTINIFLVVIAIKILGAKFGINSIYGITVNSVFFIILQQYIQEPLVDNEFMAALIGAALSAVGIGIAFINGGNSGGTDIIALIINKYRNISPGRVILYFDVVIVASSYILFESVEKIVYGYVVMAVFAYVLDIVIEGEKQSYQFMIFSRMNEKIAKRIINETGRGVTLLQGHGYYTKEPNKVVFVIARKHDKQKIMRIIKESDDEAFVSVAKVAGVFGLNFEKIKY